MTSNATPSATRSVDQVPTVEVLIPAHNAKDLLANCLMSIADHPPDPDVAVVSVAVLDDASSDGLGDLVAADFPSVRLVRAPKNLGHTRGNNRLAETSTADFILLLNSDTEFREDIVGPLVQTLTARPEAAGVAAALVWPDGSPQPSTTALPTLRFELARVVRGARWARFIPGLGDPDRIIASARQVAVESPPVQEVPFVWSTCFLIPRALVAREGLYDERFEAYDSDLDWCARQAAKGRKILFDPSVKCMHIGGASRTPAERRRRELEARRTYHRIHSGRFGGAAYDALLRLDRNLAQLRTRRGEHRSLHRP